MSEATATLSYSDGKPSVSFPTLRDHRPGRDRHPHALRQDGPVHLRPGFLSTAACRSAITYIDGDKGELFYRGYPIEELAVQCDYLEVCYLLLYGELPNKKQAQDFDSLVTHHTMVNEQMQFFMRGFRRDSHPMAVLTGLVGAMSAFYPDSINLHDAHQRDISAIRLIAKMPTLVAMAYKYAMGQPYMYPRNELSYAANFMRMMFATPCEDYAPTTCWCARWTASSSCTRITSRTPRPPRCGCARPREPIRSRRSRGHRMPVGPGARRRQRGRAEHALRAAGAGREAKLGEFVAKAKDKNSNVRLMGFGHRVYKNYDPRAKLMRETCYEVLGATGMADDPLFKLAMALEKIALEDDYFVQRKLYPNVDFYSGIVQKAIGIPVQLFTAIFALARTVGWIAQLNEMIADPEYKIGRPRQLYIGRRGAR
jgi:citrate synthase